MNEIPAHNYLSEPKGLKSWLLTLDHKRIGILYMYSIMFFFLGAVYYGYTFLTSHRFTNMALLLLITGVLIFLLGMIAEQIAQLRMDRSEDP